VLDELIPALAQGLDPAALSALRARLETIFHSHARPPVQIRSALQAVLDAEGDVDAYVATVPPPAVSQPATGAEIARRLLAAGRAEEALAALARSAPPVGGGRTPLPGVEAWEEIYLAALEADGQADLAQDLRWAAFEKRLAVGRLRAFLKRLDDFDDVEALDRALAYAQTFPSFTQALQFLVGWPAPTHAATLVLTRAEEIEPGQFELLEHAAHLLETRHPLAATLLLRAMAFDTLRWGRVEQAEAAHRQLDGLAALASQIADWGRFEDHVAFLERLAKARRI